MQEGSKYSQKTRLAEELASPFAKARSFAWPALFAAASIATYFAGTSLLAETAGLRPAAGDTAVNLAIDLAAMAGTGTFWRNENAARESRLARLAQGANIAALRAQVLGSGDAQFVRLADFRSGRGEARRVVLVVAEEAALKASMVEAAAAAPQIAAADFLVVPVLLPGGLSRLASPLALLSEGGADSLASRFESFTALAVPVEADLAQWQTALAEELKNAKTQAGEEAGARGFTVLLKKNGRVGTRRLGTPDWLNLAGDVASRGAAGLDITNI